MTRLAVYAIDSLDREILLAHLDHLPNFRRLIEEGGDFRPEVVYPPDSPTCWASIFTGQNPGRHGIFHFVDPLSRVSRLVAQEIPNETVAGKTLFDHAGNAGRRVCVLNPLLAYPPWPVNGVMIGRSTLKDEILTHPPDLLAGKERPAIDSLKGLPGKDDERDGWVERSEKLARAEMGLALRMIGEEEFDFVWTYSSVIDSAMHYFWHFFDKQDPSHPGPNKYEGLLLRFLKLHDELLGDLRAACPDAVVAVVSDHGHMRRPLRTVNLNEVLRQEGLLAVKSQGVSGKAANRSRAKLRKTITRFIVDRQLGNLALKVMKIAPWGKKLFTKPANIDWSRTLVHISDMSGVKAYVYGGLFVRTENLDGQDYHAVRERAIAALQKVPHPEKGTPLVVRVARREELYDGPFLKEYPDVIFELDPEFGASWEVEGGLYGEMESRNIVPGSHRPGRSSVFLLGGANVPQAKRHDLTLMDIAPTLLDVLDVAPPQDIDGRSVLR